MTLIMNYDFTLNIRAKKWQASNTCQVAIQTTSTHKLEGYL